MEGAGVRQPPEEGREQRPLEATGLTGAVCTPGSPAALAEEMQVLTWGMAERAGPALRCGQPRTALTAFPWGALQQCGLGGRRAQG